MAGPWEAYQQAARPPAAAPRGTVPREQALEIYNRARQALARRHSDPTAREQALRQFDTSPRMQNIRRLAGLSQVSTRQQEIQEAGRRASRSRANPAGFSGTPLGRGIRGGLTRSLFGIPERIAAAGVRFLPSAITGNNTDATYDEILQATRAATDEDMAQSTGGNIIGQVLGSVASGLGAGRIITGGAQRMASAASPVVARAGNVLQSLTSLQRGQAVRNFGRVALAGSAGGAAQAAGEGSDVATGAAVGAVAAPVLHGAIRGTVGATRLVRGAVGRRPADSILRSIISSSPETIAAWSAEIRRTTGAEPTIYEALPLGDRQAFDAAVSRMPPGARERLVGLVRERAQNMVGETAARVREIIRPRADELTNRIADDLARSRGETVPTPDEIALAGRAARSPLEMEEVARVEARNIMAPHDAVEAYPAVNDLLPQHPVNRGKSVVMVLDDPDVARMIQTEAGPLRIADRPVTVRDITTIMSNLSKIANGRGDYIERGTAGRAIQHLEDILARDHPDVLPAVRRMREAFAARNRMMEGVTEGSRTRLRENVDPSSDRAARAARNAYDSPEGTSGRTLGQAAQLERDVLASPNQALGALDEIATNPTAQQAIGRNLGDDEAAALTDLARTQTESARRLSRLTREQTGDEGTTDPLNMMRNLLSLSPGTLPFTKIQGILGTIRQFTRMPERSANRVVDMLLSQNPAQVSQAIGILSRTGEPGRRALRDIAISVGALSTPGSDIALEPGSEVEPPADGVGIADTPAEEAPAEEEAGPWSTYNSEVPYGRQVVERLFPGIEVTEDIRDPESDLGRANPGSHHIWQDGTVDVRPIPGMTFEEFIATLEEDGHEIVESRDEVNNPSGHATGPHWHVVLA